MFSPATLFAKVLLLDAGTAVLTGDADLFLDARLLTGRGFDLGLESELTFFPSGVVRGHVDLQLLVGVGLGSRGLSFPIRRREDAEGDRDAGFKIQVGDLVGAKRLSSPRPSDGRKVDKKIPSCFFWKEVERKEVRRRSEKDPSSMLGFLSIPKRQDGVVELAMRFRGRLGGRKKVRTRASAGRARTASNIGAAALRRLVVGAPASGCWTWDHRGVLVTGGSWLIRGAGSPMGMGQIAVWPTGARVDEGRSDSNEQELHGVFTWRGASLVYRQPIRTSGSAPGPTRAPLIARSRRGCAPAPCPSRFRGSTIQTGRPVDSAATQGPI